MTDAPKTPQQIAEENAILMADNLRLADQLAAAARERKLAAVDEPKRRVIQPRDAGASDMFKRAYDGR